MLAQRLPSVLPQLTFEEALETSKVYSIMGLMPGDRALVTTRPFRSPHHTVSDAGLIGGGQIPRPGEVSLAHNGVLFLDELPEFKKNVLEVLRQPLEDGQVTISRASTSLTYPARFMLVAAMNPCPCGFLSDPLRECQCTYPQIQRYKSKISGPLLDRIDLHIEVPAVKFKDLTEPSGGESSETVRTRVQAARERQKERFLAKNVYCNAQMGPRLIKKFCPLDPEAHRLLEQAMEYLGFSARAYHRILKISRTIADLESEPAYPLAPMFPKPSNTAAWIEGYCNRLYPNFYIALRKENATIVRQLLGRDIGFKNPPPKIILQINTVN